MKEKNKVTIETTENKKEKKGLKITLIIISIILVLSILCGVILILLNNSDREKLSTIKEDLYSKLILEDKEVEYGDEVDFNKLLGKDELSAKFEKKDENNEVVDTLETVDGYAKTEVPKVYLNNEEVTSYKFEKVGEVTFKEEIDTLYKNFLGIDNKIKVSKDITYTVKDTKKPTIEGVENKEITVGDTIDLKQGIKATDPVDGELDLKIEGEVDTNKTGEYKITVKAVDKNNNEETKEFTVKVNEKQVEVQESTSNNSATNTNKTTTNKATTNNKASSSNNSGTQNKQSNTKTNSGSSTKSGASSGTSTTSAPYWCAEGGTHHIITLGKYEHGWYNSWNEALEACRQYGSKIANQTGMGGNYKVNNCPGCNKYYYYYKDSSWK